MSEYKDIEMIRASDIVDKPERASELKGKYRTLWDSAMKGSTLHILERTVNIMSSHGWRVVAMSESNPTIPAGISISMHVMMEKL